MTGQELIDFIRKQKAENAEIVVRAEDGFAEFLPELGDVEYSRMRITVNCNEFNELRVRQ